VEVEKVYVTGKEFDLLVGKSPLKQGSLRLMDRIRVRIALFLRTLADRFARQQRGKEQKTEEGVKNDENRGYYFKEHERN
jgi:hypothetical protein